LSFSGARARRSALRRFAGPVNSNLSKRPVASVADCSFPSGSNTPSIQARPAERFRLASTSESPGGCSSPPRPVGPLDVARSGRLCVTAGPATEQHRQAAQDRSAKPLPKSVRSVAQDSRHARITASHRCPRRPAVGPRPRRLSTDGGRVQRPWPAPRPAAGRRQASRLPWPGRSGGAPTSSSVPPGATPAPIRRTISCTDPATWTYRETTRSK
jgi:hypothetical protein